jgi:transposase
MRQKSIPVRDPAERVVKDIRRAMRRPFTAEDKIRIVLEGLRGEDLLPMVRPLSGRWAGGPKRSLAPARSRLEPHPGRYPGADQETPSS